MKLSTAESRAKFLEEEVGRLSSWYTGTVGLSADLSLALKSNLDSKLKELSLLKFLIEEAKLGAVFDSSRNLRQAELFRDELIKRAVINSDLAMSLARSSRALESVDVVKDIELNVIQASSMFELVSSLEEKIQMVKYTVDINWPPK